jgi:predicted nucleic acid-binding protein
MVTNFIVAETHALILARLGADLARAWLQNLHWPVERVSAIDEDRARAIIYAFMDKTFSYTDATTFAVMERMKLEYAFSFDRHFKQFGIRPFTHD